MEIQQQAFLMQRQQQQQQEFMRQFYGMPAQHQRQLLQASTQVQMPVQVRKHVQPLSLTHGTDIVPTAANSATSILPENAEVTKNSHANVVQKALQTQNGPLINNTGNVLPKASVYSSVSSHKPYE
uniref:Uncharacterized protein n=1 Tax=Lygus hesperus TaxID=30085 RepID=A0A0A9XUE5_LYGHE